MQGAGRTAGSSMDALLSTPPGTPPPGLTREITTTDLRAAPCTGPTSPGEAGPLAWDDEVGRADSDAGGSGRTFSMLPCSDST